MIGGRTYKVDLVFYHRILKCFVLIDLKRGEVLHEDIGQMNFYLNYYREEMNTEGDTEPIGIVLRNCPWCLPGQAGDALCVAEHYESGVCEPLPTISAEQGTAGSRISPLYEWGG